MSSPDDDVFAHVIRTLANTTAVAISNGFPRLADAPIEVQYVITSRVRPWLATRSLAPSTYLVLEYTVKGIGSTGRGGRAGGQEIHLHGHPRGLHEKSAG